MGHEIKLKKKHRLKKTKKNYSRNEINGMKLKHLG
jgi:hypothetical protein